MPFFNYRVVTVEAVQLAYLNTNHTISIPRWVLDAIIKDPSIGAADASSWLVKKPNGSVVVIDDETFAHEFDPTPLPEQAKER